MPARSRKRGRRERPENAASAPAQVRDTTTERHDTASQQPTAPAAQAERPSAPAPHRSHGEERNEAVRATLTPLATGERPWPLRVGATVALLLGIADIVQVAFWGSLKVGQTRTSIVGVAAFSVVMLVCAVGMWRLRYWAVLGFQALLALIVLTFSFVLVTATDVLRAAIALAVMGSGGFLFFKLVRVLARLQLPQRHREQ